MYKMSLYPPPKSSNILLPKLPRSHKDVGDRKSVPFNPSKKLVKTHFSNMRQVSTAASKAVGQLPPGSQSCQTQPLTRPWTIALPTSTDPSALTPKEGVEHANSPAELTSTSERSTPPRPSPQPARGPPVPDNRTCRRVWTNGAGSISI